MPLKIAHWTMLNGSGMANVARSMVESEQALGLDSVLCDVARSDWSAVLDADVHVSHTHIPVGLKAQATKPYRVVWIAHGTPEHVFQSAVEADANRHYGAGDGFMLWLHWMKVADARVTFWPRHQAIMQAMMDRGATVDCVPLGVDTAFWSGGQTRGKFAGAPSVLSCENAHYIKWPYDLVVAWPWVADALPEATLHLNYLPNDQHRWWSPLVNRNGTAFRAHWGPTTWAHGELRNVFKSVDFLVSLVQKGDFNRLCLEAKAAGCPVISYAGNPYADYWVTEGDQRDLAAQLTEILRGNVARRPAQPVPDVQETARAMQAIYERVAA